jgi:hypothetical protein
VVKCDIGKPRMNLCWRKDMRMIRWKCGISFTDQIISTCFRARLGVEPIGEVCRLIKIGYIERRRGDKLGEMVYTDVGGRQLDQR